MALSKREAVVAFLADFLEIGPAELHDEFDLVKDFDWSSWDDEDYGLLFERFVERFNVRDARFEFGERYRGPLILKPLAWLRWRLSQYPRVAFSRITAGDLVRMAERSEWDSSVEEEPRAET